MLADPELRCREALRPDALVMPFWPSGILGTRITDAPVVVGVGPGFTAGEDCHAVVETMRGHTLGRVIYRGSALPNTSIPGLVGGFAGERVLRAPADGILHQLADIGVTVSEGDVVATVEGQPCAVPSAACAGHPAGGNAGVPGDEGRRCGSPWQTGIL